MTAAIIFALTALLLLLAWLLGQLPVFWKRLALTFGASWIGYAVIRMADARQVSETVQTGLSIALALAAVAAAWFVLQPIVRGIDEYLAFVDEQTAEVQP